jgi:hypothetical protein
VVRKLFNTIGTIGGGPIANIAAMIMYLSQKNMALLVSGNILQMPMV